MYKRQIQGHVVVESRKNEVQQRVRTSGEMNGIVPKKLRSVALMSVFHMANPKSMSTISPDQINDDESE
eukprot:45970-Eustigmatos_ZCMA.PRE.1